MSVFIYIRSTLTHMNNKIICLDLTSNANPFTRFLNVYIINLSSVYTQLIIPNVQMIFALNIVLLCIGLEL